MEKVAGKSQAWPGSPWAVGWLSRAVASSWRLAQGPGVVLLQRFLPQRSLCVPTARSLCSLIIFFIIIILIFHALPSEIQGREYNGFTAKAKTPPRAT